jgi:glyoxylase-like metal-dependent hydrolase (beta-lactamase superfamily II)
MRRNAWLLSSFLAFAGAAFGQTTKFVRSGERLCVYGCSGKAAKVLYTHARRDAIRPTLDAEAVVPAAEADLFRDPVKTFWLGFDQARFHDYEARASKWPVAPVASRITPVRGGDHVSWQGLDFQVLDTPGYTAGSVSYLLEDGGKRIAYTGDLIFGDGQLLDLYSLQTAVPEAKTRGYHGFGARAGLLLESLARIEAWKPDLLVPARGPVILKPAEAIGKLRARLHAYFAEHFATDALRWYWGDDNLRIRAGKILGANPQIAWMPMSEQRPLPDWVIPIQNSRLILSRSGAAYLIDCGNARILAEVQKRASKLDGVFITHYHDDHTDHAQAAADAYGTRVHASPELADVLRNPRAYRLPAMTANAIASLDVKPEGTKVRWQEFEFTHLYYPGQTLFHGGLLVKKDGGETLFFVGDSFTPSGIDDYCLQNRNLLDEDQGYLYCLRKLRDMAGPVWLINQHVEPMFRFTAQEIAFLETSLRKRNAILAELFPFPHPNYGVDEQWAWFEPYEASAKPGERIELRLRLTNHANRMLRIQVNQKPYTVAARSSRVVPVAVRLPAAAAGPLWIATADLGIGDLDLPRWAEAIVKLKP